VPSWWDNGAGNLVLAFLHLRTTRPLERLSVRICARTCVGFCLYSASGVVVSQLPATPWKSAAVDHSQVVGERG